MTVIILFLVIFMVWFYKCPYRVLKSDLKHVEFERNSYKEAVDKYEKIVAKYGYFKFYIKGTNIYTCQITHDHIVIFDMIPKSVTVTAIELHFGDVKLFDIATPKSIYAQAGDEIRCDISALLKSDLQNLRRLLGSSVP